MKRMILSAILAGILVAGCHKEPKTFDEFVTAGKSAYARQDYAKARDYLGQAVTRKPSDHTSLFFLGLAYSRDGIYDSAFYYMGRADVLFPKDREINQAMYTIAMKLQEWAAVRKAIGTLIETGDPAEAYHLELARLNLVDSNYTIAYAFFRMALQDSLDSPSRWLDVANSAAQIDSIEVALRVVDSAIAKFGPKKEFLMNKGLYLSGDNRYAEAEEVFRSLAETDSSQVGYRLNLAHTLAAQSSRSKKEEAYALYQRLEKEVGAQFDIDSLLTELGHELGKN